MSLEESVFETEMYAFVSTDDRVSIVCVITNTTETTEVISSNTSGVFNLSVTDSNGVEYCRRGVTMMAPHRVKIRGKKSYVYAHKFPTPAERRESHADIVGDDEVIVTDPQELGDNDKELHAITIGQEYDRELTATLTFSDGVNEYSPSISFNPSNLLVRHADEVLPENSQIDDGATISLSGRKEDDAEYVSPSTEPYTYNHGVGGDDSSE